MTSLPLQNRVDPWGQLNSVSTRGNLMGNRGILHNDARQVVRPWAHKAWVACLPSFPGPKRSVFSPGNYSELFFLDEATALAAGHRPCNTCQREKYNHFKDSWLKANTLAETNSFVRVAEIDKVLHSERAVPGGAKQTYEALLSALPNGAMFAHEKSAFLVWGEQILRWSFDGYIAYGSLTPDATVQVLTPKSIIEMLKSGYQPEVHESAERMKNLSDST